MRFLHTADWHLGRVFHQSRLTEDQSYVLDQLVQLVQDAKPDVLLIAGDVYDRAVPPPEAIDLLDDVLCRVILELKTPVVLIAGNHDSPQRLAFGSRLLATRSLHIFAAPTPQPAYVDLEDAAGPVRFYALPYAEPPVIRSCYADPHIIDHNSAMQACVARIRHDWPADKRSVLLSHAFLAPGTACESERPLSLGGAGTVDASCFADFSYVALGHLHRPQSLNGNSVHYSGSLLKYSFSEADHCKGVNLVQMDAQGCTTIERVPLVPRHDVRCIKGRLEDILNDRINDKGSRDDYVMVSLLDEGAVLDPQDQIRQAYPNLLLVDRPPTDINDRLDGPNVDQRQLSDEVLFNAFFQQTTGRALNEDEEAAFIKIVEALRASEREVSL